MASPIKDHPLTTKKQERSAVGMATISPIKKACRMKLNSNGRSNVSIIRTSAGDYKPVSSALTFRALAQTKKR